MSSKLLILSEGHRLVAAVVLATAWSRNEATRQPVITCMNSVPKTLVSLARRTPRKWTSSLSQIDTVEAKRSQFCGSSSPYKVGVPAFALRAFAARLVWCHPELAPLHWTGADRFLRLLPPLKQNDGRASEAHVSFNMLNSARAGDVEEEENVTVRERAEVFWAWGVLLEACLD